MKVYILVTLCLVSIIDIGCTNAAMKHNINITGNYFFNGKIRAKRQFPIFGLRHLIRNPYFFGRSPGLAAALASNNAANIMGLYNHRVNPFVQIPTQNLGNYLQRPANFGSSSCCKNNAFSYNGLQENLQQDSQSEVMTKSSDLISSLMSSEYNSFLGKSGRPKEATGLDGQKTTLNDDDSEYGGTNPQYRPKLQANPLLEEEDEVAYGVANVEAREKPQAVDKENLIKRYKITHINNPNEGNQIKKPDREGPFWFTKKNLFREGETEELQPGNGRTLVKILQFDSNGNLVQESYPDENSTFVNNFVTDRINFMSNLSGNVSEPLV
ncbi:uncharacterized protein LOC142978281 [Anticarsia gemmatalis]|uniref:uncharacterized protein LOC142978281 n=1 Tax=Anticarsia gemmatalis TaxID=129554 RepID=UPI003F777EF3